jgi:hypothetical protein
MLANDVAADLAGGIGLSVFSAMRRWSASLLHAAQPNPSG